VEPCRKRCAAQHMFPICSTRGRFAAFDQEHFRGRTAGVERAADLLELRPCPRAACGGALAEAVDEGVPGPFPGSHPLRQMRALLHGAQHEDRRPQAGAHPRPAHRRPAAPADRAAVEGRDEVAAAVREGRGGS
jgi:hypothetical protein